jgi:hypothetical protein
VGAFADAYAVAMSPGTRTKVTVAGKDAARGAAEGPIRQLAGQIKVNAGVSDADKIAINVPTVNLKRSPINVPASSPLLKLIGATPGKQVLSYHDSRSPDRRAKPFGAASLQLFRAVGDAPVSDPGQAKFYEAVTRNPVEVEVEFDPADAGKCATYFARWASRRGDVGPWSLPVSMHAPVHHWLRSSVNHSS